MTSRQRTELTEAYRKVRAEIGKVIIGQDHVVEELLIGLFARGHVLLVGVPGLAKTLLVSTVARISSLSFRRIQFTPDMMPSDITGTDILQDDPETGRRRFTFIAGPIFANMILADEINRTPPKTQAALLEAMQERHVSAGRRHVSAARSVLRAGDAEPDRAGRDVSAARGPARPIHAQCPGANIPRATKSSRSQANDRRRGTRADGGALGRADRGDSATWCGEFRCRTTCFNTLATWCRASRPQEPGAGEMVRKCVSWGAGPRAGQSLILAAKTRAVLQGRLHAGHRRHARSCPARPAAPDRHHVSRRSRRHWPGADHRQVDGRGSRRERAAGDCSILDFAISDLGSSDFGLVDRSHREEAGLWRRLIRNESTH